MHDNEDLVRKNVPTGASPDIYTVREFDKYAPRIVNIIEKTKQYKIVTDSQFFISKARNSTAWISLFILVIIPTLITLLYSSVWASYRYTSEFRVSVQSAEVQHGVDFTSLLGISGGSRIQSNSYAVVQYIDSPQMLKDLDPRINWREIYSNSVIDYFSRLSHDATREAELRYWERMTHAYYDSGTGIITVQISAFSPEDALNIARNVLALSERLINEMSARSRSDTLAFAQKEVDLAKANFDAISSRLQALRDSEQLLDPRQQAQSTTVLADALRGRLSAERESLAVQQRYMDGTAPSVVTSKMKIEALQHELERLNSEIVQSAGSNDKPLSSIIGKFDEANSDRAFAEKAYQSALSSLETARMEAARQQVYLTEIVKPNLPDEAAYPRPARNSLTVLALSLIAWVLFNLGAAAVREHR